MKKPKTTAKTAGARKRPAKTARKGQRAPRAGKTGQEGRCRHEGGRRRPPKAVPARRAPTPSRRS
jgi:hypothetical protein